MLAEILPKIAAELRAEQGEHEYRSRPSSAGPERCIRSMVYHALGTPRAPLPGRAVLVFDDSSWHEELTADWIRKSAIRLHSEQMKVATKVGSGSIDGIITDLAGVDRLWEHKAMNHFTFERYWKGEYPLDYFTQCGLYIEGLQKVNPEIKECLLLVKNKNNSAYLEFLLAYDKETDTIKVLEMTRSDGDKSFPSFSMANVTNDAVDKFYSVAEYAKAKTLPARPFEYGTDFPCGYCQWAKTCWDGYEVEFEALATGADLSDLETKAGYYKQLGREEGDAKKKKDELRGEILAELSKRGATAGTAGEWIVRAALQPRTSIDEEKIPAEILEKARVTNSSVRLFVSKRKEKPENGKHKKLRTNQGAQSG